MVLQSALLLLVLTVAHATRRAVVTVTPAQASQLPAIVAANPAGTTYQFEAGTYRLPASIRAKDGDTFVGTTSCAPVKPPQPDAAVLGGGEAWRASGVGAETLQLCEAKGVAPTVLSGAVLLTNATVDATTKSWTVSGLHGLDSGHHGPCCTGSTGPTCKVVQPCGFVNELYIDNKVLRRAFSLANMSDMSWFIYYDTCTPNPNGHMFQKSTGSIFFRGAKQQQQQGAAPPVVELSLVDKLFVACTTGSP
eukprot:m.257907 g.257907  ORF g.257907 m.257907 type:complete len:250 (-) comp26609_c0_seq2:1607-2356(-)